MVPGGWWDPDGGRVRLDGSGATLRARDTDLAGSRGGQLDTAERPFEMTAGDIPSTGG